ncbi:MAG: LysR family transcriptional regulator [Pseudomonadota bacterium]
MNWADLPSPAALRSFAALAETGTLSGAGRSLNVSHAAVGQQLRALERHLGVPLATRAGRGIELTPEGQILADAVRSGFARIADAVAVLTETESARPLQVSVTPAFAAFWLMPRLSDFHATHPGYELMINPSATIVALEPGGIDIAIRYGDGRWPGTEAEPLILTPRVIVASPRLVGKEPLDAAALLDAPWLQELGVNEVSDWLATKGLGGKRVKRVTELPGNLMMAALRAGDGIGGTTRLFVDDDIHNGDLVVLDERPAPEDGYYIVTRPGILRPALKSFARWLKRQVA